MKTSAALDRISPSPTLAITTKVQELKRATETAPPPAAAPQTDSGKPARGHSFKLQPGANPPVENPAGRQARRQHEPEQPSVPAPISYGGAMDVVLRINPGRGCTAQQPAIDSPSPNGLQERRFA